ncbi:MAG: peroxide stress protein YaaA [Candidatus Aminicenantes bacterium]|nr:peroxide stress protein YaaA [Candidatus Aminicenantes bacterium]
MKNEELKQRLLETRRKVFFLVKYKKLVDSEKRQGRRGDDPRNSSLICGPDFGGGNQGGFYLPAILRYSGRFFRELRRGVTESDEEFLVRVKKLCSQYFVFIVSGLYGLLSPFDLIQEYTCHMADRIIGQNESLQQIWKDLLTEIMIEILEKEGGNFLFDFLSEESYQEVFDWQRVYNYSPRDIKCYHRVFKKKAGPETLINSARFIKYEFMGDTNMRVNLRHNVFIKKDYFDEEGEAILFEPKLRITRKEVAREGVLEEMPKLKLEYGEVWDAFPQIVKNEIANAEYTYKKSLDLKDFDFTSSSICLCKAIEIWIKEKVVKPLLRYDEIRLFFLDRKRQFISPERSTLGDFVQFFSNLYENIDPHSSIQLSLKEFSCIDKDDLKNFSNDISIISKEYRNDYIHKKPMSKEKFEEFRKFAANFFKKWVPKFKANKNLK